jgi:hypothetical protein
MYRNIAWTFLGLTIVVIAFAVWMSSVHATVRIHVKRDPVKLETVLEIAKSPEQGQLQGRVVEGTFDKIQEFKVKEETVSDVVATTTGKVRIKNGYSKEQTLIKTTRLLSPDGKLFRINATVTVPSGQSLEVNAYSDKTGKEYEIPTGTTFVIPGLWIDLQKLITAESVSSFSATRSSVKVVSATDITDSQKSLEETILDQAKKTLAAEAGIQWEKLADDCKVESNCWAGVYVVEVLDKKTNVIAGQESESFLSQVKIKVKAVFYPKKDMEVFVSEKLKERMPEGRDLTDFDSSRVIYHLDQSDASLEKAKVSVTADAYSRLTAQSPSLSKDAIAGLSLEEAKEKLKSVEGTDFVEITLRPSWARSIPRQKDKIDLKIE